MLKEGDVITHPSSVFCTVSPYSGHATPSLQLCSGTHFHNQPSSPHSLYQCPSMALTTLKSTYLVLPTFSPTLPLSSLSAPGKHLLYCFYEQPSCLLSVLCPAHGTSCFSGVKSFEHLNTLVWSPSLPLCSVSHTLFFLLCIAGI